MDKATKGGIALATACAGSFCIGGTLGKLVGTYASTHCKTVGEKIMVTVGGMTMGTMFIIVPYAKKAAGWVHRIVFPEYYSYKPEDECSEKEEEE